MKKDLQLFTDAINHLVYLTTRDEYGNIRSRGIETYGDLAEDLNQEGIVPKRGYWTEASLKAFLKRIERRYPIRECLENCDVDFIRRYAWEYQSYTTCEEVCETRNRKKRHGDGIATENYTKRSAYGAIFSDIDRWKASEFDEINNVDKNILRNYKKMTRTRKL